jgi:hypothetical protein
VSGVAGDQMTFQTITLTRCSSLPRRGRGETSSADELAEPVTEIVTLGDGCQFFADPYWLVVQPAPGGMCTLTFPDGAHTLRVTDYTFSRTESDARAVAIRVGGDDVTTGRHLLYQFNGSAVPRDEESWRCKETGQEHHESAGTSAAH